MGGKRQNAQLRAVVDPAPCAALPIPPSRPEYGTYFDWCMNRLAEVSPSEDKSNNVSTLAKHAAFYKCTLKNGEKSDNPTILNRNNVMGILGLSWEQRTKSCYFEKRWDPRSARYDRTLLATTWPQTATDPPPAPPPLRGTIVWPPENGPAPAIAQTALAMRDVVTTGDLAEVIGTLAHQIQAAIILAAVIRAKPDMEHGEAVDLATILAYSLGPAR